MIKNSSATSSKRLFALRRQQQGDLRVAPAPIIEDAVAPTNVSALSKPSATRDSATRSSRWKSRRSNIPLLVKVPSSSKARDANKDAEASRTDPSEGKKNAWDSVSTLSMKEGTAAHTSPKSLHGASKSLARLQEIDDSSPTIAKDGKRTLHTVQNSVKSTRSLHVHHRVHTPPMESISTSIRKKSKSHEHHRSGTGGDGLPNNTKGSCRNPPANEEESGTVEELMKQVHDLKAQLKEKTETIVKMEVSLDIAIIPSGRFRRKSSMNVTSGQPTDILPSIYTKNASSHLKSKQRGGQLALLCKKEDIHVYTYFAFL